MAMKDYWSRENRTAELIELCYKLMTYACELGEAGDKDFASNFGYGYLSLTGCLKDGICAVIDLEAKYHEALSRIEYHKLGEKCARDFLVDIFGDREIDTINDKDKERIRQFVKQIEAEWDKED